jgi:UrcA family protein
MSTRTYYLLPALVATLAITLPIDAPHAASAMPTIRVTYQDLDLATSAGVSTLYKRIERAAAEYCESTRLVTGTRVSTAFSRCVQDAVTTTVKKIDQPGLSALHTSHSDKSTS